MKFSLPMIAIAWILVHQPITAAALCDLACRAPIPAVDRRCDVVCNGPTCTAPSSLAACDVCGENGVPDGRCTICGSDTTTTINGSNGPDVICMGGGDKTVDARGGDDLIFEGKVENLSSGQILTTAPLGNCSIEAGAGHDTVVTGNGDDFVAGGGGHDSITCCGGRNVVKGGAGNDLIASALPFVCAAPEDNVGSLLCGESGIDTLVGVGPSHQCLDGGADQNPPSGQNDCTYVFQGGTQTTDDVGTARNCARTNAGMNSVHCGC